MNFGGRRFVRWLCGSVLPPLPYPVIRGPLRGTRFILRAAAGEGGGASVYVNRVEPAGTQVLLSILKPGHVVFDIGANVGYYTLLASQRVGPTGRVVAFEPSARNISYLYRHLALNRAHNVTVIPVACFDRSAIVPFLAGANCATGRLAEAASLSAQDKREYVATVAIDEVVAQSGLVPDVMKIDVEGAEDGVLRGASNTLATARPTVFLSVHSEPLRLSCTAHLRALGYGDPTICEEPGGDAELLFVPA